MLIQNKKNSTCGIIITYIITIGMKNNVKDNDVVEYKVIIGVSSCVAFNILLLITIVIICRRRKTHYSSNVCSMEMINLNLENEVNDEEVDVFNTVLPR